MRRRRSGHAIRTHNARKAVLIRSPPLVGAVVSHHGKTVGHGHYTCCIRHNGFAESANRSAPRAGATSRRRDASVPATQCVADATPRHVLHRHTLVAVAPQRVAPPCNVL
jgi:hypothetical protein